MRVQILMLLVGAAGCSKNDPSGDGGAGDTAPAMVTVSGTITRFTTDPANPGPLPLENYPIALFKLPARVRVADGMTDATGRYSLTADTGGAPLDAYVEIAGSGPFDFPPTVSHFPSPITADVALHDVLINTNTGLRGGSAQAGDPLMATHAVVRVFVANRDAMPVAGAVVTIAPSTRVSYLAATGLDPSLTATGARGIAFAFNTTVGMVTVAGEVAGNPIAPSTFPIFAAGESHYLTLTP